MYVGTWNVGNTAPRMDAAKAWLAPARGHDIIAIAAQEASYAHSKHNIAPKDVAATLASGDDAVNDGHGTYATRRMGWLRSGKMTRFSGAVAGAVAGRCGRWWRLQPRHDRRFCVPRRPPNTYGLWVTHLLFEEMYGGRHV